MPWGIMGSGLRGFALILYKMTTILLAGYTLRPAFRSGGNQKVALSCEDANKLLAHFQQPQLGLRTGPQVSLEEQFSVHIGSFFSLQCSPLPFPPLALASTRWDSQGGLGRRPLPLHPSSYQSNINHQWGTELVNH